MKRYNVFIKPGYAQADIEADNEQDAKEIFAEMLRDNFDTDCVEADELENGEHQ